MKQAFGTIVIILEIVIGFVIWCRQCFVLFAVGISRLFAELGRQLQI